MKRVTADGKFGPRSGKPTYEPVVCLWANVTWSKGAKAIREGALDAYDTVLIRTRWTNQLTRDSFIGYEGHIYQILSYHASKQENTIQITAQEIVTKQ